MTERRWYPGTLLTLTLQIAYTEDTASENAIAVLARVVRSGADGVGFKFVFHRASDVDSMKSIDGNRLVDKKTLKQFLQRLREDAGSR